MTENENPTIAILGAGPIGLETALYARFLGYPVTVLEQGEVAEHVAHWGHVKMFTPFSMNCSSLGMSALHAQQDGWSGPQPNDQVTGTRWRDEYLVPLAKSDLLIDCIETGTTVLSVGRVQAIKTDSRQERSNQPFRIVVKDPSENIEHRQFDIVIDCTGTWGSHNWLGSGGMPAIGEKELAQGQRNQTVLLSYRIPDLSELRALKGNRFAIIGSGYSAATNILQFAELGKELKDFQCYWITRQESADQGPVPTVEDDPLEYRRELSRRANQLALNGSWLQWMPGTSVKEIRRCETGFQLELEGRNDQTLSVDHVIANVGFRGDYDMLDPLAVHRCYASGGPMAWAASIADNAGDCLSQTSAGPSAVTTTEPGFFVIGSKSYGRDPRFLFSVGLEQIRDVFTIIADRADLNLYESVKQV